MRLLRLSWLAFSFLFHSLAVQASSGDRDSEFQWCLAERIAIQCTPEKPSVYMRTVPPWQTLPLRITRWTCEDDCKYYCAHRMTNKAIASGRRIEQYYGKWAFWRLWGMQEPASVLFSLMNFIVHLRGGLKLYRGIHEKHPMRSYHLGFMLANLNLWIWSAVFHTRGESVSLFGENGGAGMVTAVLLTTNTNTPFLSIDTPFTESMDYFSAAGSIVYGLFSTIVRLYHLYDTPATASRYRSLLVPLQSICVVALAAHVTYLVRLPRFDYGYNMKANIAIGTTYNLLWISYSLPKPPFTRFIGTLNSSYRPGFVLAPAGLGLAMMGAVCLEIFDFPPWWRVIDAHSLWHLATVPIVILWYRFLLADARDLSWETVMKKHTS